MHGKPLSTVIQVQAKPKHSPLTVYFGRFKFKFIFSSSFLSLSLSFFFCIFKRGDGAKPPSGFATAQICKTDVNYLMFVSTGNRSLSQNISVFATLTGVLMKTSLKQCIEGHFRVFRIRSWTEKKQPDENYIINEFIIVHYLIISLQSIKSKK